MDRLSDEARKIYLSIQKRLADESKAPTINEISKETGLSTRKTLEALRELEDSLVIKRSQYRSRSIELIASFDESTGKIKDSSINVPILGTAPGGPFMFAVENHEGYLPVSLRLLRGQREVFLLRVVGNSMSPYLEDGDLAVVKQQNFPNERDIVVGVQEGDDGYEATIKEYHSQGDRIILQPLNTKEFKPITGTKDEISVQGIVIGAIKMSLDRKSESDTNDFNN